MGLLTRTSKRQIRVATIAAPVADAKETREKTRLKIRQRTRRIRGRRTRTIPGKSNLGTKRKTMAGRQTRRTATKMTKEAKAGAKEASLEREKARKGKKA